MLSLNIAPVIYITIWCILFALYFYLLRCVKIERLFPQGHVGQIRVAYVLISFVLSYLTSEAIYKFIDIVTGNI